LRLMPQTSEARR